MTLWAAGVQASPLGKTAGRADWTSAAACWWTTGSIRRDCPKVFVLGDLAHFEQDGHQVPGVAQPAMQMGDHVAKMIAADLKGKPRPAFRYFDKGDMATIGRMDAVAKVEWPFKAHMSGFPAWITWLDGAHLLPDRLPQPHFGVCSVDLDVLHLHARRAPDHGRPAAARLAGADQVGGKKPGEWRCPTLQFRYLAA